MSDQRSPEQEGHLGQDDDLLSGDVVFFESPPEDDLGQAVGIYVRSVERVDSVVNPVRPITLKIFQ